MESNSGEEPSSASAPGGAELSGREEEILRLVATGASNKQIAQQLVISPNTVKVHLRNIFSKIGVATRTEAALYAMRAGLVQISVAPPGTGDAAQGWVDRLPASTILEAPAAQTAAEAAGTRRLPIAFWVGSAIVILVVAVLGFTLSLRPSTASGATPTAVARWQIRTQMPTARSGLAAVAYEDQAYAIGGEGSGGVTGANERYDPTTNSWQQLAAKSLPAADISGAVIGGLIYVPGGRLASGEISNALEEYDPRQNLWEQKAPMPTPLSAYALAVYEGKLYVFGGWTGSSYVATVLSYDPISNQWSRHASMPTARGYSGAALAAGKIFVIGGTAGGPPLAANEAFSPDAEAGGGTAWAATQPLPAGRTSLAVVSIADFVYVVGGDGVTGQQSALEYSPQSDMWEQIEIPHIQPWSRLGLVAIGTRLYAFGGLAAKAATEANWTYQALYSIAVPVVQ
jgi:DNA-binding CsgD family transcriptional regulator/N-acetylneuraminic acid mutarotase